MEFIDQISAFEAGELDEAEVLNLFEGLLRTGLLWQLQGMYQRYAQDLGLI